MIRDSHIKWIIIAVTALVAAGLIVTLGMSFPLGDAVSPLVITVLLGAGAYYYHRRGERSFVTCLNALLHVTLFTACYSVLMYACGAIGRPLIDDWLVQLDARCGVHLPDIVAWSKNNPSIERPLQWAYNSLLFQTPLVIVVLGFAGDLRRLERFVLQFMLGTWLCAIVFAAAPAAGPFAAYGYAPNATQAHYLQHLHELREGVRTVVTWRGAEGLITFPSFHTTWAMLLAWAFWGRMRWFVPSVMVNAAVIAATMTTGWHYFTDVVGGAVLGVTLIWHTESRDWRRARAVEDEREQLEITTRLTDELAERLLPKPEELWEQREEVGAGVVAMPDER
jgi:membrane-associated phospholipid phosphatase